MIVKYGMIAMCILALAGCGKRAPSADAVADSGVRKVRSADGAIDGQIYGTPAPRGKFAKLQIGMPMKQVFDLIGQPTDTDAHITGKVFIPFYFGGDTSQVEAFYKGEGHLTFTGAHFAGAPNRLSEIHVNPAETGYAH